MIISFEIITKMLERDMLKSWLRLEGTRRNVLIPAAAPVL